MNSFVKDGENTDTHEEESEGNHDLAEDLEAWKEVHEHLLVAVQKAQQSIAAQKAQRRYWLEEIAWNLNDNGSLTNASRWRRVAPLVKTASSTPGYKATAPTKMKKMSTSGAAKAVKKPRKKKEKEGKGSDASKESGRQEISPPRETVRLSTDFTDTSERSVPMSESSYFPTPRGHPKGHDPQDHSLHSSWAPVYSSASLPPDEAHARVSKACIFFLFSF